MFKGVFTYIIAGLIAALMALFIWHKYKVFFYEGELQSLQYEIETLQAVAAVKEANINTLKAQITEQNVYIDKMKVDLNNTTQAFQKWKQSAQKYSTLYAKIGKERSNDCKSIKAMLNKVRGLSYDEI